MKVKGAGFTVYEQYDKRGCHVRICADIEIASTTKKHRLFIAEPMGDKHVTELAGVGTVTGNRLEENGYDKVDFLVILNFKKC